MPLRPRFGRSLPSRWCRARCGARISAPRGQLSARRLLDGRGAEVDAADAQRLGVDHQRLPQFISSSTWDYRHVRRNGARWALEAVDPVAYVVGDTGFPKASGRLHRHLEPQEETMIRPPGRRLRHALLVAGTAAASVFAV